MPRPVLPGKLPPGCLDPGPLPPSRGFMSTEVRQLSIAQMPAVWLNSSLQTMSQVAGNVQSDRKSLASYLACLQFCMKSHWLLVLIKTSAVVDSSVSRYRVLALRLVVESSRSCLPTAYFSIVLQGK